MPWLPALHAALVARLLFGTVNSLIELSSQIVLKADTNITRQSLDDHHKLLQAIRNSDSDLAESLMREHISNAKKYHFNKYYLGYQ